MAKVKFQFYKNGFWEKTWALGVHPIKGDNEKVDLTIGVGWFILIPGLLFLLIGTGLHALGAFDQVHYCPM